MLYIISPMPNSMMVITDNSQNVFQMRFVLSPCTGAKEISDDIIVVDTGSTDRTKEIAKEFTTNIFNFNWIDDFAAARNFSLEKAKNEFYQWEDVPDILIL